MNNYKIIVKNSCIKIENYNLGDCPELERNFSVYDPVRHRREILGMYYSSSTYTLYIPRGVDIWKIKNYLKTDNVVKYPPNVYENIDNILVRYTPRDEQQIEALKFMVGLEQYQSNLYEPQLSVNLSTGKGKTYCSIATIAYMRIKSIVITGSITLLNQWRENIKEYTNMKDEEIFFISGSNTMEMILSGKSMKAKRAKVYLCTHGTIRSYCDQYGWNNLDKIFMTLGVGMKFIDEAHTNFENMLMIDFFTNVYKSYYITATPERSSWNENKIYQLSIKNVPGIDLFRAELDPHTDYIAIKWNSHPTAQIISKCKNMYGLDRNKYIDYITQNPNFYLMMHVVMDLFLKCGGRGLFYIGTNEGILRVYKWIGEHYPQLLGEIGVFTSIVDKETKMERQKQKKLILSTTKSAGLGEHIEGLKMTVVVAEPFKSAVIAKQSLGRTRDNNTMYVELVDMGFRQILKYYNAKQPVFNKYALSTSDTLIEQYELEQRAKKIIEQQEEKIARSPIYFCDPRFFEDEKEQ